VDLSILLIFFLIFSSVLYPGWFIYQFILGEGMDALKLPLLLSLTCGIYFKNNFFIKGFWRCQDDIAKTGRFAGIADKYLFLY